jgi:hypothetical protein
MVGVVKTIIIKQIALPLKWKAIPFPINSIAVSFNINLIIGNKSYISELLAGYKYISMRAWYVFC